jgi:RHS repeat-associated protein
VALLPAGSTAQFYAEDMLGSSRIVTTNTGAVCYDADFYPFGGERTYINSCLQNNYKFEGKERDTETGNDDFGARYYSWRFGRWLSADWSNVPVPVPYANLTNPQTLNLYSMIADDPESFADLDGHECGQQQASGKPNQTCSTPASQQNADEAKKLEQDATNPPPTPAQNPSQRREAKQIAERLIQAGEGLVNLELAKVKTDAAIAAAAAAPESGVSAVASAYLGVSAAGSAVAGTVQLLGAASGKTKEAAEAAQAVSTVTSVAGIVRTVTSGSIEKGSKWAAYEAVITTKPSEVFKGKAVEVIAKIVDFFLNFKDVATSPAH